MYSFLSCYINSSLGKIGFEIVSLWLTLYVKILYYIHIDIANCRNPQYYENNHYCSDQITISHHWQLKKIIILNVVNDLFQIWISATLPHYTDPLVKLGITENQTSFGNPYIKEKFYFEEPNKVKKPKVQHLERSFINWL